MSLEGAIEDLIDSFKKESTFKYHLWCVCGHQGHKHYLKDIKWWSGDVDVYACFECNCKNFKETSKLQAKINKAIK